MRNFVGPALRPKSAGDGSASLRHLVYASQAVVPLSPRRLEALLIVARHNNRRAGVTGVLIHHGGQFMQCLEGPPAAVRRTFDCIHDDARHRDIRILLDEPIADRSFAAWDMACADAGDSLWLQLSTAQWETSLLLDDDRLPGFALLERFWKARAG